MPRPTHCRRICHQAPCDYFKPAGIPLRDLEEVALGLDELEALRLADLDGLYQEQAAGRMGVSRPTFGRIIESARRKVAEALVLVKAIAVQGGHYNMATTTNMRHFECADCGHRWEAPFGTGRPAACPKCKSANFRRAEEERGHGRCARQGRGQGMAQSSGEGAGPGTGQGRTRRRRIRACAQGGKDQAKNASES